MKLSSFIPTLIIVVLVVCVGCYCAIAFKRKHGQSERFHAHNFLKSYVYDLMAYKEDEEMPKQMEIKEGEDFALVITGTQFHV